MACLFSLTPAGSLGDDTKRAFVTELERVGRDPVYWVRREASFALGALAKVVPEEVVVCSLVRLCSMIFQHPLIENSSFFFRSHCLTRYDQTLHGTSAIQPFLLCRPFYKGLHLKTDVHSPWKQLFHYQQMAPLLYDRAC